MVLTTKHTKHDKYHVCLETYFIQSKEICRGYACLVAYSSKFLKEYQTRQELSFLVTFMAKCFMQGVEGLLATPDSLFANLLHLKDT